MISFKPDTAVLNASWNSSIAAGASSITAWTACSSPIASKSAIAPALWDCSLAVLMSSIAYLASAL
jgi:hypothetical protein